MPTLGGWDTFEKCAVLTCPFQLTLTSILEPTDTVGQGPPRYSHFQVPTSLLSAQMVTVARVPAIPPGTPQRQFVTSTTVVFAFSACASVALNIAAPEIKTAADNTNNLFQFISFLHCGVEE